MLDARLIPHFHPVRVKQCTPNKIGDDIVSRGERIRTFDFLLPKQAR